MAKAPALTIERHEGTCEEGCGAVPISKRSRFAPGHDARLKSRLYDAIRTDEGAMVKITGDETRTVPATALLEEYGWPRPAERKARAAKPKAEGTVTRLQERARPRKSTKKAASK